MFSEDKRKAMACNAASQTKIIIERRKAISMKFCLFDACFQIIYKGIKCISLPTIVTISANLVNNSQCYLFKQFK